MGDAASNLLKETGLPTDTRASTWIPLVFQTGKATDGRNDVNTGVRLAKEAGATGRLDLRINLGIVVRRDEDHWGTVLDG